MRGPAAKAYGASMDEQRAQASIGAQAAKHDTAIAGIMKPRRRRDWRRRGALSSVIAT